jgi:hypothetical protein
MPCWTSACASSGLSDSARVARLCCMAKKPVISSESMSVMLIVEPAR